jgi:hypothetical protein
MSALRRPSSHGKGRSAIWLRATRSSKMNRFPLSDNAKGALSGRCCVVAVAAALDQALPFTKRGVNVRIEQ